MTRRNFEVDFSTLNPALSLHDGRLAEPWNSLPLPDCTDWITGNILLSVSQAQSWSVAIYPSSPDLVTDTHVASAAGLEPWFPTHTPRDIYLSLLHLEEKIPDSILKAALLQRACEDIRRILAVRNQKGPLNSLLQRGSVGDDLWQRFLRAEKEIEAELRDVVEEVSHFALHYACACRGGARIVDC